MPSTVHESNNSDSGILVVSAPVVVDSMKLVFYGDILLLCLFTLISLMHSPCGPRRFHNWYQTMFLRRLSSSSSVFQTQSFSSSKMVKDSGSVVTLVNDIVEPRNSGLVQRTVISTFRVTFSAIKLCLRRPFIFTDYSIGEVLIAGGYGAILASLSAYKSNIFSDPGRTGVVAMSQIPLVFFFAARNNFLGFVLGDMYEKVRLDQCLCSALSQSQTNFLRSISYIDSWVGVLLCLQTYTPLDMVSL